MFAPLGATEMTMQPWMGAEGSTGSTSTLRFVLHDRGGPDPDSCGFHQNPPGSTSHKLGGSAAADGSDYTPVQSSLGSGGAAKAPSQLSSPLADHSCGLPRSVGGLVTRASIPAAGQLDKQDVSLATFAHDVVQQLGSVGQGATGSQGSQGLCGVGTGGGVEAGGEQASLQPPLGADTAGYAAANGSCGEAGQPQAGHSSSNDGADRHSVSQVLPLRSSPLACQVAAGNGGGGGGGGTPQGSTSQQLGLLQRAAASGSVIDWETAEASGGLQVRHTSTVSCHLQCTLLRVDVAPSCPG